MQAQSRVASACPGVQARVEDVGHVKLTCRKDTAVTSHWKCTCISPRSRHARLRHPPLPRLRPWPRVAGVGGNVPCAPGGPQAILSRQLRDTTHSLHGSIQFSSSLERLGWRCEAAHVVGNFLSSCLYSLPG